MKKNKDDVIASYKWAIKGTAKWVIKGTAPKNKDFVRYVGYEKGKNKENYVENIMDAKLFASKSEAIKSIGKPWSALIEKVVKVKVEVKVEVKEV